MDPIFLDDIDCESFFDLLEDLVDLPSKNVCIWDEIMPLDDPVFLSDNNNSGSDSIAMPNEDAHQLEWFPTFTDDSYTDGGMTITKGNNSITKETSQNQFRNSSPVSVLEISGSRSSSSEGKTLPPSPSHCGTRRARSKRPCPPKLSPRSPIQLTSTSTLSGEMNRNQPAQAVRKCSHCEITTTPQWRAGPMGKKTLCNACGVRYASGRLAPEYRPAASPTFIPSVHSNSHKEVIQMQIRSAKKGNTSSSVLQPE